jgi:D-xylose 1-dehydrogenase (NADP+, D-xylono-1,5-lactone-forming)
MKDIVRYGVLSTARIARNQHIPAAAGVPNASVSAISSRNAARAAEIARELEIPKAYGSYDELLADPEIDAVINALPNSLHCEWTIKAAEAGKHILCEKPLAITVSECHAMIDAAAANGVLLYEGFTQHFNPILNTIREKLGGGDLGEIRIVRSELTYSLTDWENDVRADRRLGGGALFDAGCYVVNTIRTLLGEEPEDVYAMMRRHAKNRIDSTLVGLMRFPREHLAYIATGMEEPFRFTLEVICERGSLGTKDLFSGAQLEFVHDGKTEALTFEPVNRFALQIEHFSDAVLGRKPLRVSPEDGLNNVAVLVALKRSAESGEVVRLSP